MRSELRLDGDGPLTRSALERALESAASAGFSDPDDEMFVHSSSYQGKTTWNVTFKHEPVTA